jgi:hypothetical protein
LSAAVKAADARSSNRAEQVYLITATDSTRSAEALP